MDPKTKKLTPFRFRDIGTKTLLTNEVGDYDFFEPGIVEKILSDKISQNEQSRLGDMLIRFDNKQNWKLLTLAKRLKDKLNFENKGVSYLLIIPTLRCDLSCSYCQVSRAPLKANGFDWNDNIIESFKKYLDKIDTKKMKIEFQGGEATLRPDLIKKVIDICETKFPESEFVVCTNLMTISKEMDAIYKKENVFISTSIDGPVEVMDENRTQNRKQANQFFKNLNYINKKHGHDKVSALPTITEKMLNEPRSLIDFYMSLGFESIFLRPVNYMGFARKNYKELSNEIERWNKFYEESIGYIIELNKNTYFEEFYFSLLLKNVVQFQNRGFVDFRSPNFFLQDYGVIDFDGKIYPSDEARMLSRTNHVDLSVGTLEEALNKKKINELNFSSMNQVEPDCVHCVYMPFCGIDIIDDMSRYNRVDSPKLDSWFCRRHMATFDLIFKKIEEKNIEWLDVFLKWIYKSKNPPKTYEIFYDRSEV
jgi:His-Xaa-Ser system radical SAM maturase HxsB